MLRHFVRSRKCITNIDYPLSQFWHEYSTKNTEDNDDVIRRYEAQEETAEHKIIRLIKRDIGIIKDMATFWKRKEEEDSKWYKSQNVPATEADIVIIGGGAIGSAVAYWLKQRAYKSSHIVVVEKDPMYRCASTTLSVGGLRQQFSLEENIQMSLFGAEFLRNINKHLGIDGEPPIDPCFHPYGYLLLASEEGAEALQANSQLQNSLGANNKVLSATKLKQMFPWLNTDGVAAGCLGLEKEGWFDPWTLLCSLKRKAIALGVEYVTAEAKGFLYKKVDDIFVNTGKGVKQYEVLDRLIIELPDGTLRSIKFANVVVAAGAFSADITKKASIGTGEGILSIPLPVEPRKRFVYCFHCPDGPGLNTPLTVDTSGTYFRRDGLGGNYICGRSPEIEEEPPVDNLDVDYDYFNERVWPCLAHRVKAFEELKVKSAWAGYYEYNTFDKNGIIGHHPYHKNMVIATGFSGHGIQQAPAVGRAVSEIIINSEFQTIDLSKLGFSRFITQQAMREVNIV